jgi:hypothetical protein
MDLDEIKRGLRAEIKKRENEQYFTFQCNVRQMCKDVLAKLEEQESEIAELKAQKAQAEDDCAYWKTMAQENVADNAVMAKQRAEALKREDHNMYKRCLAMAYVEWLKQMSLCNYPDSILYRRAARRERKWKKIAEKFKPNKEAK